MSSPVSPSSIDQALARRMELAAAGDPQIIRHKDFGLFVLSGWKEHTDLVRKAGGIVPDHVRADLPSGVLCDLDLSEGDDWDLDRVLAEGCSGVTFGPHPDASYEA